MAYTHGAPWYYSADGTPVQAVATEEGWTYPLAPADDDGLHVQVIEDPAQILQLNTQALGFNPDDKRVNPDQSVSIMNPQTQQYEQAVAAGESSTYMPISMAQEQNLPIYQYAQEPQDTGTLGQIMDIASPLATLAAIAAAGNFVGNGINSLSGGLDSITSSLSEGFSSPNVASNAVEAGAETFPYTGIEAPVGTELGTGSLGNLTGGAEAYGAGQGLNLTTGSGLGLNASSLPATANLPAMGGGQGLVAGAGTMFGGAAIPAAVGALGAGVAGGAGASAATNFGLNTLTNAIPSAIGATSTGSIPTPTPTSTGGYQIPWGQIAGGLMEYAGANQYGKDVADAMKYAVDKADPFASQRPFYQGELSKMFTDSNYFNNAPLLKGANQNAINDTSRALASQGYNMSGNVPMEIAQRLQNNNMTYGLDLMNKTGGYAGAGFGPGQAGTIAATGGTAVAQAGNQGMGALGSIFQNVLQGQQPTSAQQVRGTQPNQTLQQYLFA